MFALLLINYLADCSSRNWNRIGQMFLGIFPEPGAEARVVCRIRGVEYGNLDQWQREAVGYIKDKFLVFAIR